MKNFIALLAVLALAGLACGQPYINGPFVTHPGAFACVAPIPAGNGSALDTTAAPAGPALSVFGFTASTAFRVADDFTVPPGQTWYVTGFKVYAYQSITSNVTTSTLNYANYRIWNGPPNAGGVLVADFTGGNQFVSSTWTNAYRNTLAVITSATPCTAANTVRKIMEVVMCGHGLVLGPGNYWLDYALAGTSTSGPFTPPISILGTPATGNAIQQTVSTSAWAACVSGPTVAPGPFAQGVPFEVGYSLAPAFSEFESNSPASSLDFNGVQSSTCAAALTQGCPGSNLTATLASTSPLGWQLVIGTMPLVARSAGGVGTPNGQVVNVNLADPFLTILNLLPVIGFPGPYWAGSPVVLNFAAPPIIITGQMLNIDPTHPDGFSLSQGVQFNPVLGPGLTFPIAGPVGDDAFTTVNLANVPPLCNATPPTSFAFYGTSYTQFFVSTNGRVTFGAGSTAYSATVAGAAAAPGFVGGWADLNVVAPASITVTNPAPGVLSVNYNAVQYLSAATVLNTYQIILDSNTNAITMANINGMMASTASMFVGISKGLGATDPGMAPFSPAPGAGATLNGTDMLYVFGPGGTMTPGVTNITFTPNALGNYNWTSN